jgi:hypothetical protein
MFLYCYFLLLYVYYLPAKKMAAVTFISSWEFLGGGKFFPPAKVARRSRFLDAVVFLFLRFSKL